MKEFFDPSMTILLFDDHIVFLSGDVSESSSSRTPVNPISDGGEYNW